VNAPAQLSLEELMLRQAAAVGPPQSVYDDAPPRRRSIEARFREFHAANPQVLGELLKLARRARGRGATKLGIGMLWEVLRWQLTFETYEPAETPFKLNDHYRSRYVRLICEQDPELGRLFELRELRAR
jgi:hypothetical protein